MRRTKLVWFAVGAATSAVASIVASGLVIPTVQTMMMRIEEPEFSPTPEEWKAMSSEQQKLSNIASQTGNLLRECGVTQFSTTLPGGHALPYVEFDVMKSKPVALDCVLEGARKIDARISFQNMAKS